MTIVRQYFLGILLLLTPTMSVAELEALPTTESGFQRSIQAQIKPGDDLETALKALESQQFECREFSNKNPVFHCSRMDMPEASSGGWLYQVMIEPRGGRVRSVSPSLGKMRR